MASKFQGIRVDGKKIQHSRDSRPLDGVSAQLVNGVHVRARVDEPTFLMLGGLARLLLKKPIEDDDVFLSITGPRFEWCVPLEPGMRAGGRDFAVKVNAAVLKSHTES